MIRILIILLVVVAAQPLYGQKKSKDYYKEAFNYATSGNHAKAIELFTVVMSMEPDNDIPVYGRACSRMKIGDIEGAIIDFSLAIEINPYSYESYYNLGVIEYEAGKLDIAKSYFLNSLELDPTNVPAMFSIANVFYQLHDIDRAIEYYEKSLKENRSLKILQPYQIIYCNTYLASALSMNKSYDKALMAIDRALELEKNNYEIHYIKGSILYEKGDYANALVALNRALELKPDFGYGYFVRGMVNRKTGNSEAANADFEVSQSYGYIPK